MNAKKFFWIALFIGFQACVLQILDQLISPAFKLGGFGWISFQAWAMYFLSNGNIEGGIKTLCGYIIGIIGSIAIFEVGGIFGSLGFFAMPLTLLILVPFIIYFELAPLPINYVPSIFIGAGVYFGFMSYVTPVGRSGYLNAFIIEVLYCIIGLIFGFVTVTFRQWYEKKYC